MPNVVCAVGLLISSVAADGAWLVSRSSSAITRATQSLRQLRREVDLAVQRLQVSSVDVVLIALTNDASEDVRLAAPSRWQAKLGHCALSSAEAAAIKVRLGQIAAAGHAKALSRYEIVLRPGEQLGLATHRPVKIIDSSQDGTGGEVECLASTVPTLQLQHLDIVTHQLRLDLRLSLRATEAEYNSVDRSTRFDRLTARDDETLLVLVKSPHPVDWHANEGGNASDLHLDLGDRLLLMTPTRRARPERNGSIAVDRGVPRLAEWAGQVGTR
jgi:hypothetical protein